MLIRDIRVLKTCSCVLLSINCQLFQIDFNSRYNKEERKLETINDN